MITLSFGHHSHVDTRVYHRGLVIPDHVVVSEIVARQLLLSCSGLYLCVWSLDGVVNLLATSCTHAQSEGQSVKLGFFNPIEFNDSFHTL